MKTIAAGVHFFGRHSAAILLKGALLFSFLSLLPNEKNIEVQPEGLYYLWLINFTVKTILFYFQNIREGKTNKFFLDIFLCGFFPLRIQINSFSSLKKYPNHISKLQ